MISAKNIKTNLQQTFTEKDWKDIQFHFPGEWEQVEFENVEVSNKSKLIITVIVPPKKDEETNQIYIDKMKASYPKGWAKRNEFIDQNGVIFEKGKLVGKKID